MSYAGREPSQASAYKGSGQEDVQKQELPAQAYLAPAQWPGLQGFLGGKVVSLTAQGLSLPTGWGCFAS